MPTPDEWQVIVFTAGMAAVAVLLIVPPGLALAWVLARRSFPGKSVVETLVTLPLVLPPVATGLILLKILGRRGPVGGWLESALGLEIVFTWRAVMAALAVMAFPMLVRMARTAFEEVEREQEESAATLGAPPWTVWWRVTLPLARRGIVAGMLMAYARALGEFGATIIVAGSIAGETQTVALALYQAIQLGEGDAAGRLTMAALGMAFVAVWLGERFARPPSLAGQRGKIRGKRRKNGV